MRHKQDKIIENVDVVKSNDNFEYVTDNIVLDDKPHILTDELIEEVGETQDKLAEYYALQCNSFNLD